MVRRPLTKDFHGFAVRSYYRSSSPACEYLSHIAGQLGRFKLSPDDLPPYQSDLFHELQQWTDERSSPGLTSLYDYRRLDFNALARRSKSYQDYGTPVYLPKPRISVSAEVTSKGNLSVRWHPWQMTINYENVPLDEWAWHPSTTLYFERPDDELIFIRGVDHLRVHDDQTELTKGVNVTLIEALASVFFSVTGRLKRHFDVQMLTDFGAEETKASTLGLKRDDLSDPAVPTRWSLIDTIDCRRATLQKFIDTFEAANGMSADVFRKECEPFRYDHGGLNSDRASRHFKRQGFSALMRSA